jgi:hypothetical protein
VIVRILGEGQYDLEGSALEALKKADAALMDVVAAGDAAAFTKTFQGVLDLVRVRGRPVPVDRLVESDLVLPADGTTLDEARRMFTDHPV